MNEFQVMDRYWKEVIQVSTLKNDIKVWYLYDNKSTKKLFNLRICLLFLRNKLTFDPEPCYLFITICRCQLSSLNQLKSQFN